MPWGQCISKGQRASKLNGALGSFFHATNGVLQGCAMSVLMINMLTTTSTFAVDDLEGAIVTSVQSLPRVPPPTWTLPQAPDIINLMRRALQKDKGPAGCTQKTFGCGMDQFTYWEHASPCTCGYGPPEEHNDTLQEAALLGGDGIDAELNSPPSSPVKLPSALPEHQEPRGLYIASMRYVDDTYP